MNAPSIHDLHMAAERDARDEKMDQIREILVGDSLKMLEARIVALENRIGELEIGISRQLDAVEARIDALSQAAQSDQQAALDMLASSIVELGNRVRQISKSSK